MKNKLLTTLVVLCLALCLCATLAACDLFGGGGGGNHKGDHTYEYEPIDRQYHSYWCTKGDESGMEEHNFNGDVCANCGYVWEPCDHSEVLYHQFDNEYHVIECLICHDYDEKERHTFKDGYCTKCKWEKGDFVLTCEIDGLYYSLDDDNGTAEVTAWHYDPEKGYELVELSGTVTIPSTVTYEGTTYTVTAVAEQGFDQCGASEIILPDTILRIDDVAFANCFNLTAIKLPKNLQILGNFVFGNSHMLREITIPASVTEIGEQIFDTADLTVYCEVASQPSGFSENWWGSYSRPVIVWNVASIASNSEYDYAILNDGSAAIVKYKGEEMYLSVPATIDTHPVTEIAGRAFYGLMMDGVSLPEGVVSIGDEAFFAIYNGNSINRLSYIDIPTSLQSVGKNAIYVQIAYYAGAESLFDNDNGNYCEVEIFNSGTEAVLVDGMRFTFDDTNKTAQISVNAENVSGDVILPSTITRDGTTYAVVGINDYAFWYAYYIETIYVPASIQTFGENLANSAIFTIVYFEGEIGDGENFFGGYYSDRLIPYAKYDEQSKLWYTVNDGVAAVARQKSSLDGTITIPDTITVDGNTYNVTEIGSYAFYACSGITEIVYGNNVTTIGRCAFEGCSGLTEFSFDKNVTTIGDSAFDGCTGLTEISIGNSVTTIGSYAFYGCSGITELVIGDNVTEIGYLAFYNCKALAEVVFGDDCKLQTIGFSAFANCSALKTINIPESVTQIESKAFENCRALTGVYITNLEKWLEIDFTGGYDANPLYYVHNLYLNGQLLTKLEIPSSVTEVHSNAFVGWNGTEVIFHKGVTGIGYFAFRYCSNLQKVEFASNTTEMTIGEYAFSDCVVLSSVKIPSGIVSIDRWVFNNCPLLIIRCEVESRPEIWNINWCAQSANVVWNYKNNDATSDGRIFAEMDGVRYQISDGEAAVMTQHAYLSGEVVIPSSITYKGVRYSITAVLANAFAANKEVTRVTIGSNVRSLGGYSFGNAYITVVDFATGSNLTAIGENVFNGCSALEEIIIPQRVISIGAKAFANCASLAVVKFENGSSLATIGSNAFNGCSSLEEIFIPQSVTKIGESAFANCTSLVVVGFDEEALLETIASRTFEGCSSLEEIELPQKVISIGEYAFYNCVSLVSVILPDELQNISAHAFDSCLSLCEITLPVGLLAIGDYAFINDVALTVYSVETENKWYTDWDRLSTSNSSQKVAVVWDYLNNDVANTGYVYTFVDGIRYGLKDGNATVVAQPRNVVSAHIVEEVIYNEETYPVVEIVDYAFYKNTNLKSVVVEGNIHLTTIGKYAFAECHSLNYVVLGENVYVDKIDSYAFQNCASLTEFTMPEELTAFQYSVFDGCENLSKVHITSLYAWFRTAYGSATSNPLYFAHDLYLNGEKLTEITVPEEITRINFCALCGWHGEKIVIGAQVTSVASDAFRDCLETLEIVYETDN